MKRVSFFTKWLVFVSVIMCAICLTGCGFFGGGDDDGDGNGNGGGSGGGSSENNTKEKAKLVTVGYSSEHTISSSGEHWFKFVGTGEPVIFETKGNVVDTYISGLPENTTIFWDSDDNSGEGYNALFSKNVNSGETYFIRITAKSGTSGTYTFVVTQPTFNIKTNPIQVAAGYSSSHTINSSGQHWFSFQGTGESVIFETDGNVVTTNMELYIGSSTSAIVSDKKRISFSTVPGITYYIKITGNSGTYTFNAHNGVGDGSSISNAIPVTVGYSSQHTFKLGSDEHWFSFFGTGEPVIFETKGNVVDTYISGLPENTTIFWDSDDNSGEGYNALFSKNVNSGETYFIRITAKSGTKGTYTFVVRQ